ncbi:uncharacterized protein A4U43_C04F19940 [Asparagus officinalis]|uniref:Uncharacterized protein n=1 Tax=Asparagus officinalis TaxID=4686 RepID=A0A5P1F4Z6_ASPOF|nr:uncharacterized protein A4U43_C04F19940 [Asparagus officinalis]
MRGERHWRGRRNGEELDKGVGAGRRASELDEGVGAGRRASERESVIGAGRGRQSWTRGVGAGKRTSERDCVDGSVGLRVGLLEERSRQAGGDKPKTVCQKNELAVGREAKASWSEKLRFGMTR